jgi:hypothetical protein
MERSLLTVQADILFEILDWIDLNSFMRMSATCHDAMEKCRRFVLARRLLNVKDGLSAVRAAFTCTCGRSGWNIHRYCVCWQPCSICLRKSGSRLRYITYACRYGCNSCFCAECGKTRLLADCIRNGRSIVSELSMICERCASRGALLALQYISIHYVSDHFAWRVIIWREVECSVAISNRIRYEETPGEPHRWALLDVLRKKDPYNPLVDLLADGANPSIGRISAF